MKVYAKHEEIQEFLKEHLNGVEVVEEPSLCNYMITGRFTSNDYHRNLRGVIIPYTGHNGIDLDEMRDKNLKLFVTPTRSRYVAEKAKYGGFGSNNYYSVGEKLGKAFSVGKKIQLVDQKP